MQALMQGGNGTTRLSRKEEKMSQGTPRKFSEKIAIMERKQNEDQEAFANVMRDVRTITSSGPGTSNSGLAPPIPWQRPGGSLPNVHEMVQHQQPQQWPYWQPQPVMHSGRGRSPVHFHPYKQPKEQRVPPIDYHINYPVGNHLQPPEAWSSFCRARSDPAIHMNVYQPMSRQNQHDFQQQPPHLDSQLFVERGREDAVVGSLPNLPAPSCAYHPPIQQRHSMGMVQQLQAMSPVNESQSAPTSPAGGLPSEVGPPPRPSWAYMRPSSISPETMDIPNIVLTGTDGQHQLDCFQDLQDLHLDPSELQQLLSSEQVDPACETQLLE